MVNLFHGFTSIVDGDMSLGDERRRYLASVEFDEGVIILPEQVHANQVAVVDNDLADKVVNGADGLVYKRREGDKGVVLGVLTADCVPILAFDQVREIIGVVHAGWRGTLQGVTKNLIGQMVKSGARLEEIKVTIGPHIGVCCYDVPESRVKQFLDRYNNELVSLFTENKYYLDLVRANFLELINIGVKAKNISVPPSCTVCQSDKYFSFRASGGVQLKRQMGYIGFRI